MINMDISVTPNYSYIFDFENDFIHQRTRKWMVENWTWVFYYCGIYMLVIFGGQHFMQNRPSSREVIQRVISLVTFVQIIFTGINISVAIIYMMLYVKDALSFIYYTIYVCAMLVEIFPCCYYGTYFELEFEQLTYSIFSCNWIDRDKRFKQDLRIFAEQTLRKRFVIAGTMFRINLDTFFATCKFAYSLFAVVMQMRFQLRGPLIVWNTMLAMFSIMGAFRTAPELLHVLRHYGLFHSVCVPSYIEQDRVCGFWTWLFVLSKLPELGDTIFIVLRKQPLIFLHWYHHITVLIYSWFSYTEYTSSARWFIVMNYCVHSVMYSYYALKAARFNPPRFISMIITSLQLTQMIVGCAINVWAHGFLKTHGRQSCNISQTNINLSIAMYFSYFVLFARFFYKAYLSPDGKKSRRMAASLAAQNTAKLSSSGSSSMMGATSTTAASENGSAGVALLRKPKLQ